MMEIRKFESLINFSFPRNLQLPANLSPQPEEFLKYAMRREVSWTIARQILNGCVPPEGYSRKNYLTHGEKVATVSKSP